MSDEAKKNALLKRLAISWSGFGGVLPNGEIVDRREHPAATPLQANPRFGIPAPREVEQTGKEQP